MLLLKSVTSNHLFFLNQNEEMMKGEYEVEMVNQGNVAVSPIHNNKDGDNAVLSPILNNKDCDSADVLFHILPDKVIRNEW